MAPVQPCAKYQYVVTQTGPKILPVEDLACKDEESPADYNAGGYLPVKVGDSFKTGRYRVIRKLGENCHSALKVVKSAGRYAETARDEIKILSRVDTISRAHPGRSHIVTFLDSFVNQGPESSHVCMVFEPLGENLLALIERHKKTGVPKPLVKVIAKQVLLGLQYLHDECDLVHTDIKPENILITIPDVQTHIHAELSMSPTPTSRRVGVPLPAKTRTGVTIPYTQQRARRQVQIFDSQPLSSPSRSAIDLTRSAPGSWRPNANLYNKSTNSSGANSLSGSLLNQHVGLPSTSGTAKSLGSGSSKFTSGLTATAPQVDPSKLESRLFSNATAQKLAPLSPSSSTSSSTSSMSSAGVARTSSAISTPPTSVSHSLGAAVAGFMNVSHTEDRFLNHSGLSEKSKQGQSREGIPVKGRNGKGKASIEDEIEEATSTSWKDVIGKPSSWTEKILPGSYKSSSHAKSKLSQVQGSNSSSNAQTPSFWKDLGTGALAPAVLVSAVAGADGGDEVRNPFDFPPMSVSGTGSGTSSATVTVAPPSRNSTPVGAVSPSKKPPSIFKKAVPELDVLSRSPNPSSSPSHTTAKPTPSLLSQTAPMRTAPPSKSTAPNSHPSAHHTPSPSSHKPVLSVTTCTQDPCQRIDANGNYDASSSTVADVLSQTPSAPPPTPVQSPRISPMPDSATISSCTHPIQVPVSTNPDPVVIMPPISIKIADLGNATPSTNHYTEDIQTRQYRAPEAILGRRDWDGRADIWSVACVIFELLTSEFLFDPHGQGERFTKDDDHMAQIIELLGDFALDVKMGGKYSRELFDHSGNLRYIHELRPWPLKRVMTEKYSYPEADAVALSEFLLPMLSIDMKERSHARDMLDHPWLVLSPGDEEVDW
ncbi:hypothetical protein H0H92_005032 [Tricholoma furcatifolium]|nr:hypothetical protein H0H92_005032 [Tricholoma furcatifolium]